MAKLMEKHCSNLVTIVPATAIHIQELKANLRPCDADEILKFGVTIQHAIWKSYRSAIIRKTAFIDGKIAAIWGVNGTFMGSIGTPWLMTTQEVKKISPLKFTRIYQEEVFAMLKLFPKLVNWVDSDYTGAIRLLDIIGFKIGKPEPMGSNGAMYQKFEIGS